MESTLKQFQNSRTPGFRASPDLNPCNLPVDTGFDAGNIARCSVTKILRTKQKTKSLE